MGLLEWLFGGRGAGVDELARRLDVPPRQLRAMRPNYRQFHIPKQSGGRRRILAPDDDLKRLQRRILRRLLARLRVHPAVHGFEPGRSIVTNARAHQGQEVVVRLDLVDFFPTTNSRWVKRYFRRVGWNRPAAEILTRLCTFEGGLPQGAPTSPRLSNLVNYRLDARLAGIAAGLGGVYTRYADDITISFPDSDGNERDWMMRGGPPEPFGLERHRYSVRLLLRLVRHVVGEQGYRLHRRKKRSVRRRHHRQIVTGLVVNDGVRLPRETRRWLRAVDHRAGRAQRTLADYSGSASYGRRAQPTLTPSQREGWAAFEAMIERQAEEQTDRG